MIPSSTGRARAADMEALSEGSVVNLACDSADNDRMVVTSKSQNDVGPESDDAPSAG